MSKVRDINAIDRVGDCPLGSSPDSVIIKKKSLNPVAPEQVSGRVVQ